MLSFPPANIYSSNTILSKGCPLFSQSDLDAPSAFSICSYGMYHIYPSYTDFFSGLTSFDEQKVPEGHRLGPVQSSVSHSAWNTVALQYSF